MRISCTLCGGSLSMLPDGGAVCNQCGIQYPLPVLQNMLKKSGIGTPPVSSAPPVRKPPVVQNPPVQNPPVQRPRKTITHHIRNEQFGLTPDEYRYSWGRRGDEWNSKEEYFYKVFEYVTPGYTVDEWRPYFEQILTESFPEYPMEKQVSSHALCSSIHPKTRPADFVLYQDNKPSVAIYILPSARGGSMKRCRLHLCQNGIETLLFYAILPNRKEYIQEKVQNALNHRFTAQRVYYEGKYFTVHYVTALR